MLLEVITCGIFCKKEIPGFTTLLEMSGWPAALFGYVFYGELSFQIVQLLKHVKNR